MLLCHLTILANQIYVIDSLHGEIECHELANWSQTSECGTNSNTSKAHLRDWCIDDTLVTIFLPEATRYLKIKCIR